MTKADLIERLVCRGLTRSVATQAVEGFITEMAASLAAGESIFLRGFATFRVRLTAPKKARDIKNGSTVLIPARRDVKLILSHRIKDLLHTLPE
ncbi:MAG: integration host factor subunit beta [Muribaculaceae bacterium]|nr:integration host factor subunit beta [Muribaculaceae bacterium]